MFSHQILNPLRHQIGNCLVLPLSPKAPDAKAPTSGKGYRVLSEDDFIKEREEQGNSQFDALKDLEFDE